MSRSTLQHIGRSAQLAAAAVLVFCMNSVGPIAAGMFEPDESRDGTRDSSEPATIESLDRIGSGELLRPAGQGFVPMPLLDMRVDLRVTGIMVRGVVTQSFANPTAEVIDALYVFPLPERAAVDGIEMRIGDRRIVAILKEREQARITFEAARQEGKKASLLEQERPNLFKTAVANINPGEEVQVRLEYLEEVSCRDGEFSLAFPLTFTPRYVPPNSSITPPNADLSSRQVEGFFAGPRRADFPRASIQVRIGGGLPVEGVRSSSHSLRLSDAGDGTLIAPEGGAVLADRDFLLSWTVRRGREPEAAAYVEDRPDGRYALVMVVPPIPDESTAGGLATDTLFIVDVSGSMEGPSIHAARRALLAAVDRLRPGDTFDLLKFNQGNEEWRNTLQPVDSTSLSEAREWIQSLHAGGGTEIVPALVRGLEMMRESTSSHAQRVLLITDGAVSNEEEAFEKVSSLLGEARLHVIGIGNAPNRYLMRKLAVVGRGMCEFIDGRADVGTRMDLFFKRLERPVMTDVTLDYTGTAPLESYPQRLPDLYAGEPLVVSLKLDAADPEVRARLGGRVLGGWVEKDVLISAGSPPGSGVATRWARAKVEGILDTLREGADPEHVRREVIEVATAFHLVTPYTSLVAVEDVPTADGKAATVQVPNCMPEGSGAGCGALPQGGTYGTLMLLIGLVLTSTGAALLLFSRRTWVV